MVKQHYVDSSQLEEDWFNWLVASSVPSLEPYRMSGQLWTKIVGHVKDDDKKYLMKNGRRIPNPSHPLRKHCIQFGNGNGAIHFNSKMGIVQNPIMKTGNGPRECLPLERPFQEQVAIYGRMSDSHPGGGYHLEQPARDSWDAMLQQISKMCSGISMKFKLRPEEREELAHEAITQVASKLHRGKLVYIPGKAPVFSLLTTTIHRCMYSTLSRNTKQHRNATNLAEGLISGAIPPMTRSLCLYDIGGSKKTVGITHR